MLPMVIYVALLTLIVFAGVQLSRGWFNLLSGSWFGVMGAVA